MSEGTLNNGDYHIDTRLSSLEPIKVPTAEEVVRNHVKDTLPKLEKVELKPFERPNFKWYEFIPYYFNKIPFAAILKIVVPSIADRVSAVISLFKGDTTMPEDSGNASLTETVKGYLLPMIVRWLLKVGGGFLLAHGVSQGSVEEIAGAALSVVLGIVVSLVNHKKAINTPV